VLATWYTTCDGVGESWIIWTDGYYILIKIKIRYDFLLIVEKGIGNSRLFPYHTGFAAPIPTPVMPLSYISENTFP